MRFVCEKAAAALWERRHRCRQLPVGATLKKGGFAWLCRTFYDVPGGACVQPDGAAAGRRPTSRISRWVGVLSVSPTFLSVYIANRGSKYALQTKQPGLSWSLCWFQEFTFPAGRCLRNLSFFGAYCIPSALRPVTQSAAATERSPSIVPQVDKYQRSTPWRRYANRLLCPGLVASRPLSKYSGK